MTNKIFFLNLLALFSFSAFASESGAHHGHASDLIAPFVNVAILAGFLIYKLKKPLNDYFQNQAKETSQSLERASLKSKEAQVMMDTQERKNSNLQNELAEIKNKSISEIQSFEKAYSAETNQKVEKMKLDAVQKVEAEKKAILNEINSQLLDEVISKAKLTIKSNQDYQKKASHKLIEGMNR